MKCYNFFNQRFPAGVYKNNKRQKAKTAIMPKPKINTSIIHYLSSVLFLSPILSYMATSIVCIAKSTM